VEVGEAPEFADLGAFKKAVLARAKVRTEKLAEGEAEFTGAGGKRVTLRFAARPSETAVGRDGAAHDWTEHGRHLYRAAGSKPPVIEQAWLGGTLAVRAGKTTFTARVSDQGLATFKNE
jgi:hypothetical protein